VVMILLLLPVTAVFFLIYQTRFYDYGWIWSFLPVNAVLAWGVITVVWKEFSPRLEGKIKKFSEGLKYFGVAAAVAVIWLCGNQGQLQEVPREIQRQQMAGESILQHLETEKEAAEGVVWGPKIIMQYLRSHSGEINLYYGKDMWDAKSGAYDYDAYTEEEIAGYNWMEIICAERNLYLLEYDQAPEVMHAALAEHIHIKEALEKGVNVIILPEQISPWVERKAENAADSREMNVTTLQAGEYVVWCFK